MKGISAIIATVLLLLITIALAGTAYVFITGLISPKVESTIELMSATCTGNSITIVISNLGTQPVTLEYDADFLVDGTPTACGAADLTISGKDAGVCSITSTAGVHTVIILGPANSPTFQTWC